MKIQYWRQNTLDRINSILNTEEYITIWHRFSKQDMERKRQKKQNKKSSPNAYLRIPTRAKDNYVFPCFKIWSLHIIMNTWRLKAKTNWSAWSPRSWQNHWHIAGFELISFVLLLFLFKKTNQRHIWTFSFSCPLCSFPTVSSSFNSLALYYLCFLSSSLYSSICLSPLPSNFIS